MELFYTEKYFFNYGFHGLYGKQIRFIRAIRSIMDATQYVNVILLATIILRKLIKA